MKISARLSLSGPALTRARMVLVVAGFAALSVAVVPWVVIAATQTWTGGGAGGSGWASPNNWNSSAGPSPSDGDDVVLAQVQGNPPNNFDINETMPARRGTSAGRDACAPRPKQYLASALQRVASFDNERPGLQQAALVDVFGLNERSTNFHEAARKRLGYRLLVLTVIC